MIGDAVGQADTSHQGRRTTKTVQGEVPEADALVEEEVPGPFCEATELKVVKMEPILPNHNRLVLAMEASPVIARPELP